MEVRHLPHTLTAPVSLFLAHTHTHLSTWQRPGGGLTQRDGRTKIRLSMGEQQHMTEGKNSANRSWVVFDSCTLEVMWDHRGHLAETYWYMLQVHKIVVRDRERKKT